MNACAVASRWLRPADSYQQSMASAARPASTAGSANYWPAQVPIIGQGRPTLAKFDFAAAAPRPDRAQDDRHVYCFVRKRRDSVFPPVSPPDKENNV